MAQDYADYYRGLAAQYTDAIRASDFKANIVMFYLSIAMGPCMYTRDKFPAFLTLPVVISPFLIIFFFLFVTLMPRFPKRGSKNFYVAPNAKPEDFQYFEGGDEASELRLRCSVLSDILYWKTFCLRIAFFAAMASVLAAAVLLAIYGL